MKLILCFCLLLVPAFGDVRKTSSFLHHGHLLPVDDLPSVVQGSDHTSLLQQSSTKSVKPGGGGRTVNVKRADEETKRPVEEDQSVEKHLPKVDQVPPEREPVWKEESEGTRYLRKNLKKAMPWLTKRVRFMIYDALFYAIILTFFSKLLLALYNILVDFRKVRREAGTENVQDRKFGSYLHYRFAYWFAWTDGSRAVVLILVTLTVLFGGAFVHKFFTTHSLVMSTWASFVWLVAPDAGAEEKTAAGAFIGAIMSIGGLVIFALLLTLLQDGFQSYLEEQANAPVVESQHTVLIGLTEARLPFIQELCCAYQCDGGTTICVLTEMRKEEMEEFIRKAEIDLMGSRVLVRTGRPWHPPDLEQVAADAARSVIIMADHTKPKEQRDSFALQVTVTLRSQGWPAKGELVVVCSLLRNFDLFQRLGGRNTEVVLLDRFLAKLLVQCSSGQGIARAVGECLGFRGSELYVKDVPEHIRGLTLAEASTYFPKAILVGSARDDEHGRTEIQYCPPPDYRLNKDESVVTLALSSKAANPKDKAAIDSLAPWLSDLKTPEGDAMDSTVTRSKSQENEENTKSLEREDVFIIGWNEVMSYMLLELDITVPPKSKVYVLSAKSKAEREEFLTLEHKRNRQQLENITEVEHIEGQLGSRYELDAQADRLLECSRIFILNDEDAHDYSHADMCTIATLLQIRDIFSQRGRTANIPIIPEIMDQKTVLQCSAIRSLDFMNASGLPSQILAMIAYQTRITAGLEEFLSDHGHVQFKITELGRYCNDHREPDSLNFFQASALVHQRGNCDVLLGWSLPYDQTQVALNQEEAGSKGEFHRMMSQWCQSVHPEVHALEWALNPKDKVTQRPWTVSDRLVVLSPIKDKEKSIGRTKTLIGSGQKDVQETLRRFCTAIED